MNTRILALILALAALVASGCSALPKWVPLSPNHIPSSIDADRVPEAIEKAEAALARDDTETAVDWMRAAAQATGLVPEQRDRVQVLLEKSADRRIEELGRSESGADALADMVDLDLPRQLSVQAGLRAAELMVAEDRGIRAFEVLRKLDTKFPMHYERQRAGDLMCGVGLVAIQDGPGFLGFFSTRDEGQEILEYVILNAPWAKRSDEAYLALSELYERDRDWDLAVDRLGKLVLNQPASPLRVRAQAHIPHMRLASIKSPEYDRTEVLTARREIEEWLLAYSGRSDLEASVRIDLGDALRRLSENDMIVSRFYHRVDNAFGARQHATRALAEAREANDEERVRAAQEWLDGLPPAEQPANAAAGAP